MLLGFPTKQENLASTIYKFTFVDLQTTEKNHILAWSTLIEG